MGSSFAAAPAVTEPADDSPWFCGRSRDNYAHQLAKLRGLSLVDVTCSGATTKSILEGGQFLQPAQIDAVTTETELITITVGGNDIDYIGNMMAMGCGDYAPWYLRITSICRIRNVSEMVDSLSKVQKNLIAIVDEVRRRAPRAKVVLLSYPIVLPERGSCERLGIKEDQVSVMRDIGNRLSDVTRAAAEDSGALFLDIMHLTHGHDVCASDPWINGLHPARGLLGAPLHPTLPSMTASAQVLNALLDQL